MAVIIKPISIKEIEKKADELFSRILRGEDVVITYKEWKIFEVFLEKYAGKIEDMMVEVDGDTYSIKEVSAAVLEIGVDLSITG